MYNIIKTIIEAMVGSPAITLLYSVKDFQNLNDDFTFPAAFLDPLEYRIDNKKSGNKERIYKVSIFFCDKADYDWTYQQHYDNVINGIEGYVDSFLNRLENEEAVRSVENIDVKEVVNAFDSNISGLVLTCDVNVINFNYSTCD